MRYLWMPPPVYSTKKMSNAYLRFGDIMYVDHWFHAKMFKDEYGDNPLRDSKKRRPNVIHINSAIKRPDWYRTAMKVEFKDKYYKLPMQTNLVDTLLSVGGKFTSEEPKTLSELEYMARKKHQKDWRIEFIEALESRVYQRHGRNKWLLIELGKGYA